MDNVNDVVANNVCTGCGTCAGACPHNAIDIIQSPDGRLVPSIVESRCKRCGLCHRVCPQIHAPADLVAAAGRELIGPVLSSWLARSADDSLANAGQSGGFTTALLTAMLRDGLVDAVLTTVWPDGTAEPSAALIETPQGLRDGCGSKYCPVSTNKVISEILRCRLRVAVVGLACHMHGWSRAMEALPGLRDCVRLRVGLFCSGTMTLAAKDVLCRASGIPRERIASFAYRDKSWRGWPGDVRVTSKDGHAVNVNRLLRMSCKPFFVPLYCRLCADKLNCLSDIAVGDAYGFSHDRCGRAAVLVRTRQGQIAFEHAVQTGMLKAEIQGVEELQRAQQVSRHLRRASAYAAAWGKGPRELPAIWREEAMASLIGSVRPCKAFILGWHGWLATGKARRILLHVPSWAYRLHGRISMSLRSLWARVGK